jgi:NitT/TauT family transport system permease protein
MTITITDPKVARLGKARRASRRLGHIRTVALPICALIVLAVVWECSVFFFKIPVFMLPSPHVIWTSYFSQNGVVVVHTLATLKTVVLGFLFSALISLPLAVAIASSVTVANTIYPLLVLTQSIPKVALAPILVVMLGAGEAPRVVIAFLVAFFPLATSLSTGLIVTPPELVELGRAYNATRWQELWRIRFPYAIPFIFNGVKLAVTYSVIGAVVGEFVAADAGLGYQIMAATAFFNTPVAFGALIMLALLGIVLFQFVVITERVFFPWSASGWRELS